MQPGGVGYTDTPSFGGFGPKSPCSDHAMELGDMEAAFVGNLARYCMAIGTIPRHSLKGLWWVNGECKGISTHNEDAATLPIQGLINHLTYWAPYIIGTEGVDDLLRAGEETRWYSQKMFPQEAGEWIPIEEAARRADRTVRTVQRWIDAGSIRGLGTADYAEVVKEDIDLMLQLIKENRIKAAQKLNERGNK